MMKMYRCRYLAHGLYIHYDCFRHCHLSIHSPNERDNNVIFPYSGPKDKVDWDKLFDIKEKLVLDMKNGDIPSFCRGCHWIEEFDENSDEQFETDLDRYIDMIWIGHSNKCNACCIYCFSHKEILEKRTIKGYDILPLFREMLEKKIYDVEKSPYSHISFAMGEPVILKNFDKIIDIFDKYNNRCFVLYTNGIIISKTTEKILAKKHKDMRVVISLDSGSREVYKKVKKTDKFNQVCKNIQKYALAASKSEERRAFGVKYIIIPDINDTKEEIDKWFDLCVNKLGVKFLIADIEEHWFVSKDGIIPQYVKDLLIYIREKCRENDIEFEFYDRALVLNL